MKKSISQSSMSERNSKFRALVKSNPALLEEVADARVCNDIAVELYNLRMAKGITQKDLAESLGVKQSNISRWEKAGYQGYKVKMLSKIARHLGSRLWISVLPPTETYFHYFKITQLEHNKTTIMTPSGNPALEVESSRLTQINGISVNTKGTGAYASV